MRKAERFFGTQILDYKWCTLIIFSWNMPLSHQDSVPVLVEGSGWGVIKQSCVLVLSSLWNDGF